MNQNPIRILGAPGSPYSRKIRAVACYRRIPHRWRQQPFPYQGKCLRWLRESYAALAERDRRVVDQMLANTGCDSLFAH